MTFAPGDPRVIQRFFMGQPGVVYSRPAWPNLPPGVPYQPNRYYPGSAETYGVPLPPGVPLAMIRAANGLGDLGPNPRFDTLYQASACTRIGGRCRDTRVAGAVPPGYEIKFGLCPDTQGGYAQCVAPVSRSVDERTRPTPPPVTLLDKIFHTAPAPIPAPGGTAVDPNAASAAPGEQHSYSPPVINTQGMPSWMPYAMVIGGFTIIGGILYLVGRQKNRRRNARRRNQGQYELVYSTGGHGGPYPNVAEAMEDAERRIRGNRNERWIAIVRNRDVPNLWDALAVAVLRKQDEDAEVTRSGPLEMRHLIGSRRRNWKEVGSRSR